MTMHAAHDDFATEPIPGLPELLPEGERILWQGAPRWSALAASAYHARSAALYFGILLAWRLVSGLVAREAGASIALSLAFFTLLAGIAVATLLLLGWLAARTTMYTITNKRVVLRIGIALPMTLNIPFKVVAAASARVRADNLADIPLHLAPPNRLAFLVLWPHCRPWHLRRPEPMLRCVPDGARVARILSDALAAFHGVPAQAVAAPAAAPGQGVPTQAGDVRGAIGIAAA